MTARMMIRAFVSAKGRHLMSSSPAKSTDDTLLQYFIVASSARLQRRLESLSPYWGERLIRVVSSWQRKEAVVMQLAIGEASDYSLIKTFDQKSAARSFSRVVCPLVLFGALWIAKYGMKAASDYSSNLKKQEALDLRFLHVDELVANLETRFKGLGDNVADSKVILRDVALKLKKHEETLGELKKKL